MGRTTPWKMRINTINRLREGVKAMEEVWKPIAVETGSGFIVEKRITNND